MDCPFGQCVLYALKDCTNKSSIMLLALPLFFQIMLKIMLVFEKDATLLAEEEIQLGDKIINDYAFYSNSLLSARFTGNYEHLGRSHVFSAIRELNFVEVQNIKIMFFSTWKICQTFDPLISCSLRCLSTPDPDPDPHPPPLF